MSGESLCIIDDGQVSLGWARPVLGRDASLQSADRQYLRYHATRIIIIVNDTPVTCLGPARIIIIMIK